MVKSDFRKDAVLGAGLVLLAALAFRLGLMTAAPEFDELYHVLAARSLNDIGELAILDGAYTRANLYTRGVAGIMSLVGDDGLTTARLLSLAFGCLLPAIVFLWVRSITDTLTAGIAAAFAVVWPQGILESQFVRFYAPHVFFFFAGAAAVWVAVERAITIPARVTWIVLALASWALALHLQINTLFGILGASAWVVPVLAMRWVPDRHNQVRLLAAAVVAAILVVIGAYATGLLGKAWEFYRWTPLHAAENRDYLGYYHNALYRLYPLLWWTIPAISLYALWSRPRLATYCLTIFLAGFLLHSFGGMKAHRYLSFVMPFLFVVWAIALAGMASVIWVLLNRAVRPAAARGLAAAGLLAALAFVSVTNGFVQKSVSFARGLDVAPRGDWRAAANVLEGWTDATFVATTRELHMIQVLGDFDMLVSRQRLTELDPPPTSPPISERADRSSAMMPACGPCSPAIGTGSSSPHPIGGTISGVRDCSDT